MHLSCLFDWCGFLSLGINFSLRNFGWEVLFLTNEEKVWFECILEPHILFCQMKTMNVKSMNVKSMCRQCKLRQSNWRQCRWRQCKWRQCKWRQCKWRQCKWRQFKWRQCNQIKKSPQLSDSLPIKPLHSVIWTSNFLTKGETIPCLEPPILNPAREAAKPKPIPPSEHDYYTWLILFVTIVCTILIILSWIVGTLFDSKLFGFWELNKESDFLK